MKIKRENLMNMYSVFQRLAGRETSVRFHYLLLKNRRLIEPEVESIEKASVPPKSIEAFEEARIKLCESYCEKDDNGNPKQRMVQRDPNGPPQSQFVMVPETKEEFENLIEELKEEHKEALDQFEAKQKEVKDLLEAEVEITLHTIKLSEMPKELSGLDIDAMFDIIEDDS